MTPCATCGTENRAGARFCRGCGSALALACPACGAAAEPGQAFCDECGAAIAGASSRAAPAAPEPAAAERRLVSVLFADLVGFTALSESRDPEEVRELLSRYFDTCRRLISLYGGTVEKFIGDAVMAVWGAPVATEDDAERAVRAALDLVAAVSALGQEVGAEDLRARVGVLTGEAAVTLGAEGQGMVAGDLVNTAARIQTAADPGTVFVGDATRRATEQTIVFADAGSFELKGKEGLTPLWRAERVISGLRGSLKSHGLEAPFVGRDRELRQMKELFHTSAGEKRAHLVSVTGIAGIGKSRLGWEFYKYFDGIAESVYWHRGRCLSYGEGVTYWALADMVRMRCRIGEDEEPGSARAKLTSTLEEHILDAEERAFVEPRLAHLLGLAEHQARDRQDLFAAWRLFFERLAATYPTVLAFEDMQWADESLLDFVEYLLEWSRSSPVFVLTLARPELVERRPTWGAGQRNFTSLYLEPLSPEAMEALLAGLVPGLPVDVRDGILARAEGVPLYAVETIRMLLDRGALVQDGPVYRPVGEIGTLEVPETLHALIAARLDGLTAEERRLLQDAAVLGKTFTKDALGALAPDLDIDALLAALVRKEVLGLQADPRSPEHGQYGFLQDLVRHVAYETLSRRERKSRHLAAAEQLAAAFAADEEEVVEVIASHFVAAFEALPDAEDAAEIREKARTMLTRAGARAASLAAAAEAARYYQQAADLADEVIQRAALLADAGEMAYRTGNPAAASALLQQSIELYESEGDTHGAARALWYLGRVDAFTGRRDESLVRMEQAYAAIKDDEPDEDLALLAAGLATSYWFSGDVDRAAALADQALEIAERQALPEPLTEALVARGAVHFSRGFPEQSQALMQHAGRVALAHDLTALASRVYFILSDQSFRFDRYVESLSYLDESLALSERMGSRPYEWGVHAERTYPLFMLGRWDEAMASIEQFTEEQLFGGGVMLSVLHSGVALHIERGDLDAARGIFTVFARIEGSTDMQERAVFYGMRAALRRAEGSLREALADVRAALESVPAMGLSFQTVKQAIVEGVEAALALGDAATVEELLTLVEQIPRGSMPPYLEAQAMRFRARIAGDAAGLAAAAARFDELGLVFWHAVSTLELSELDGDASRLERVREVFEQLRARPWLARVEAATVARAVSV